VVEHAGGDAGYRAHFLRFPDQRLSVIALANLGSLDAMARAYQVADLLLTDAASAESAVDQATEAALAAEVLEGYTGMYYNAVTGQTRLIELRDGGLVLGPGQGLALRPIAEDTLQIANIPRVRLRLARPSDSGPLQLHELIMADRPVVYAAVRPVKPTVEELAAYCGEYHSPELDVVYTVAVEDGQITILRRKHGATPLQPTFADAFTGAADVRFTRDAAGAIEGFLLTTGRVRSLRFVRRSLPIS